MSTEPGVGSSFGLLLDVSAHGAIFPAEATASSTAPLSLRETILLIKR
jgi:hypothetical protein